MDAEKAREIVAKTAHIILHSRPEIGGFEKAHAQGYLACLEGPEVYALSSEIDSLRHAIEAKDESLEGARMVNVGLMKSLEDSDKELKKWEQLIEKNNQVFGVGVSVDTQPSPVQQPKKIALP